MITKVSLVFLPLLILTFTCVLGNSNMISTTNTSITYSGTFSGTSQTRSTGMISLGIALLVTLITIAVAIILVASITVLGSGLSGSVIPILFMSIIGMGLWAFMSAFGAFALFMTIPYDIGIIIYFALTTMFVLGIASLSISSGGD